MYCPNCGKKINNNWNNCPNCGSKLMKNKVEKNDISKEEMIYSIIFGISFTAMFIINAYFFFFYLVALVSIVTGLIRCPKSKLIKILFWLFVGLTIIGIILILLLVFACIGAVNSWPSGLG